MTTLARLNELYVDEEIGSAMQFATSVRAAWPRIAKVLEAEGKKYAAEKMYSDAVVRSNSKEALLRWTQYQEKRFAARAAWAEFEREGQNGKTD